MKSRSAALLCVISSPPLHTPSWEGRMAKHLRRREFIVALGVAAAWPLAARAQQPPMPIIGFFHHASPKVAEPLTAVFQRGLKETGFIDEQNRPDRRPLARGSSEPEGSYGCAGGKARGRDLLRQQCRGAGSQGSLSPASCRREGGLGDELRRAPL